MNSQRFSQLTSRYPELCIGLLGDFCLDRYLEIDPALDEVSIETGRTAHNVVNVRSQPGAAGTILNNLLALGVGRIFPIGFCGKDGEGYELLNALHSDKRVHMDGFHQTKHRRTFTYTKPLLLKTGGSPEELNRLDIKNWSASPAEVEQHLIASLHALAPKLDALIVMDQVDLPDTGTVTAAVRTAVGNLAASRPELAVLADSRRGLAGWPPCIFKMNAKELGALTGRDVSDVAAVERVAADLATKHGRPVFITLAEKGMVGASHDSVTHHIPSLPIRGEIDIVGAGDSVSANLATALAAGATIPEAISLASAAASTVIHQLGTTGTASVENLRALLLP
jgi:rfaE bifunctional protein kinase chain/domain